MIRLALDGATSRLNGCKKEKERAGFEAEVELARERLYVHLIAAHLGPLGGAECEKRKPGRWR